jgi:hypothetical protein
MLLPESAVQFAAVGGVADFSDLVEVERLRPESVSR